MYFLRRRKTFSAKPFSILINDRMSKQQTKPESGKAQEAAKPSKESIRQNTEKENERQAKKDTMADRVQRNDNKDQE